jgi:predicted ATPase
LLLSRLDSLSLPQQEVLQRAAVFGTAFELEELIALCQGRLEANQVEAALEGAVQASLLAAPQGQIYHFDHPLIQETIYATLAYSQRQAWHTRVGDWLANQEGARETPTLELITYHYLQGSDQSKAAEFGCLAGDRAKASRAYAGAITYYQQVLALPEIPIAAHKRAAEGQADVLALQGDYAAAQTAYRRAAELGSETARAKQAVLSGDPIRLRSTRCSLDWQPWLDGTRAWRLAQQGQHQAALALAKEAAGQPGPARPILEELVTDLRAGNSLGDYQQWLHRFVNVVCERGLSGG